MPSNWRVLARAAGLMSDGDRIDVALADGRSHRVRVAEEDGAWRIWARAARQVAVAEHLLVRVWERNRGSSLVGLRIDDKGRLVGEAWVPAAGATAGEFEAAVRAVAIECDRVGFVLTGEDRT